MTVFQFDICCPKVKNKYIKYDINLYVHIKYKKCNGRSEILQFFVCGMSKSKFSPVLFANGLF